MSYWSSSSGRIELDINPEESAKGYHPGQCDDDIAELRQVPHIKKQLNELDPKLVAEELKEMGAWDEIELADHQANLDRILWIACSDIAEQL
jgi:hypothetical protein